MKESTGISVVIVNYNVKDLVLQALNSIYTFTPKNIELEVIVIDNQSTDGSQQAIASNFPQVILVNNQFNAGFPAANNQGFRIASGEYIFMLNPDTEFVEDSLSILLNFIQQNKNFALIAPKLLNSDGSHQLSTWRYPSIASIIGEMFWLPALTAKKNYKGQNFEEPFEAESFSGAALFFHSSLFETIGMLDEKMFWIEDIDFCYRMEKAGLKKSFVPSTSIIHHSGQSAKKNYNISISNQVYNKIKFFKKHYSPTKTAIVKILSALYCIIRFLGFGILSPFNKIYPLKAKAYLYTLKRVFNPPAGIK